jgi:hypothetical protein
VSSARSWATFCMGLWLMGTIAMAIVATQNFFTIDRLLRAQPNAKLSLDMERLGHDETRALLYYFSSELNRLYFQYWNFAQLPIGILALWLVGKDRDAAWPKWGIVAMLGIVLFLTALITPRMVSLGRTLDFVPRVPVPDGLRTFGLLHATYTVFDGIELILGCLVTLWLVKGREEIRAKLPRASGGTF